MCLTCKVLLSRLRPNDIIFMSLLKPDIITIFDFDMKKLNATSNPMEAVATTAFESLDDMAWLNGLQVKFISYESDVIINSLHMNFINIKATVEPTPYFYSYEEEFPWNIQMN